jgi:hypothetical protein
MIPWLNWKMSVMCLWMLVARVSLFSGMTSATFRWKEKGYKDFPMLLSQVMVVGFPLGTVWMIAYSCTGWYEADAWSVSAFLSLKSFTTYLSAMGALMTLNTFFYGVAMALAGPAYLTVASQLLFPVSTLLATILGAASARTLYQNAILVVIALNVGTLVGVQVWESVSSAGSVSAALAETDMLGLGAVFFFFVTVLLQPYIIRNFTPNPKPVGFPLSEVVMFAAGTIAAFPGVTGLYYLFVTFNVLGENSLNLFGDILSSTPEMFTGIACGWAESCAPSYYLWAPYWRVVFWFAINHQLMLFVFRGLDNDPVKFEVTKQTMETLSIVLLNWDPFGTKPLAETRWLIRVGLMVNSCAAFLYYYITVPNPSR